MSFCIKTKMPYIDSYTNPIHELNMYVLLVKFLFR